jgi:hypothetical protein
MGAKGDRASKEPLAKKLYADGLSLAEISRRMDISDTSLARWKSESLVPGADMDEWDRGRAQKRGNIQRLKDLFERQLEYVEGLNPGEVTAPMMDTLSKLGSLVEKWDKAEIVLRKIADAIAGVDDGKPKVLDAETIRTLREQLF